jgi:hypothetical protein
MFSVADKLMPEILHVGDKCDRTPKYVRDAKLIAYIWRKGA